MTPSQLKQKVESSGNEQHYFTRSSMKFFGDTMKNYGCKSAVIDTRTENSVHVWELCRKNPVKHGLQSSTYFNKKNFKREFIKGD